MPKPTLAEFELFVMLAVVHLSEDAYGGGIRREIEGRTGRPVSVGALYATLSRLEDKGFLNALGTGDPTGKRGRPRKYYEPTDEGLEVTQRSADMIAKMMDGFAFRAGSRA